MICVCVTSENNQCYTWLTSTISYPPNRPQDKITARPLKIIDILKNIWRQINEENLEHDFFLLSGIFLNLHKNCINFFKVKTSNNGKISVPSNHNDKQSSDRKFFLVQSSRFIIESKIETQLWLFLD